jgi:cytochrome c
MPALKSRVAASALAVSLLTACGPRKTEAPTVPGADPERGKLALRRYGCGTCHTIPGIRGARGLVGPSLAETGRHVYIAGVLPNDPDNLVRWIRNPPAVDPLTAMPVLGVSDGDARDMAEYLYRVARR